LILEFGIQIEATSEQSGPTNFEPEVRVILAAGSTRSLGEHLLRTAQQQEKASQPQKQTEQVKATGEK
jgi:hypothetical protein